MRRGRVTIMYRREAHRVSGFEQARTWSSNLAEQTWEQGLLLKIGVIT